MKLKDCFRHELIGWHAKVVEAENEDLVGLEGEIIDETKESLVLLQGKCLLKSQVVLEIDFDSQKMVIDGKALVGRGEDRLKRNFSKKLYQNKLLEKV